MNQPTPPQSTPKPWLASLLLGRPLPPTLRRSLTTLALLLTLGRTPTPTQAATITVVNSEVAIVPNGRCSLIEAIANANDTTNGLAHTDCAPGNPAGADTIQLPNGGRFTLTTVYNNLYDPTGLPPITSQIIISGNDTTIIRDSDAPAFRLLAISSAGDLTLDHITLSEGTATSGGAIHNQGTLTITNSLLSGNTAARGGAIFNNYATLTLTNSTLDGNTADEGGGLYTYGGPVTIERSTLSDNAAAIRGGGLFILSEQAMLTNSTVSGNTAEFRGGGLYNRGIATLTNTTLTANIATTQEGGGIFNDGTTILTRSLLSGNSAALYSELYNSYAGSIIANNYNLFGHSNNSGSNFEPGLIDLVPAESLDAILNPTLADNGGPPTSNGRPTSTHTLSPNSPALDRAPSADCDFAPVNGRDQRNALRNIDANNTPSANECDTGAFEQQPSQWLIFLPSITL